MQGAMCREGFTCSEHKDFVPLEIPLAPCIPAYSMHEHGDEHASMRRAGGREEGLWPLSRNAAAAV
jgi:hypothetical protein